MFAAYGRASFTTSVTFLSQAGIDRQIPEALHLQKRVVPVRNCRSINKRDLKLNDALPRIEVDPETYVVKADGVHLTCEPMAILPMAQRYFLF